MNDMTPQRKGSLIERAAEAYDFARYLRAPVIEEDTPEAPEAPVSEVFAPTEQPKAAVKPPAHAGQSRAVSAIDRAALSANGLLVPGAPVGALAEEFRLVKRQLLNTAKTIAASSPSAARSVLVSSAQPNDGKTYCALNLAISMAAERDVEVLLVDADFAKPDVVGRLGITDGPGLLDALADPKMAIEDCVVATDIARLSVLPSGAKSITDTELLASARTAEVIAALLAADPRRILIFDSPPVLAASPAAVLAGHAGQVMLVVRADRTSEGDVRQAVAMLDACEHIQLVLNAVSYAPGGRRFGYYYGEGDAA